MRKAKIGEVYRTAITPTVRSVNEKKRTIEFLSSTETPDRYGDVIRAAGFQLDAYKRNPVFLWAHKSSEPPIGRCVEIHVEQNPPALVQTIEFADAATYEFADTIFRLYAGGFLNAVSVGFIPLEMEPYTDLEGNQTGYDFTSCELLELSAVPVPANPEALARAATKGFDQADLQRVFSPAPTAEAVYREVAEINHEVAVIAVAFAARVVREAHAALKAAGIRPESSGELSLKDLLAIVKQAGADGAKVISSPSIIPSGEITTLDELAAAVGSDGIAEFERAVGIETESETFSTSRKWRDPGRVARGRE